MSLCVPSVLYWYGEYQFLRCLIWFFDFIEMFYDHFSVRSLLAKLDDDEDEVGLKEKPEDTRYIKKITSK